MILLLVAVRTSLKEAAMWVGFIIFLLNVCPIFCEETIGVLILARGGSKGIRLKNIQTVGGVSLLGRAVSTAKQAGLNDITVSTDHPLIALESMKYGVAVWRRSRVTATDWAPSIWGISEFLNNRTDITVLVLIQTTSPFLRVDNLRNALYKLEYPSSFDCIFSVTRSYKLRWEMQEGTTRSLNFNIHQRPRRQDWSGELVETGAFYIARRKIIEQGTLQNNNCSVWEVSAAESLEVDTYHDLKLANVLHKYCLD